MSFLEYFIVALIVSLLGGIVWYGYADSASDTMELRKDEWQCVKTERRVQQTPMLSSSKMLIRVPTTLTVCVEYKRNGEVE